MSLDPALRTRIDTLLQANPVVLFMKGSPDAPRCGFSAKAAGILSSLLPRYASVDVLEDGAIREGIKEYGSWPTIPQLYVKGELVGGSDIIAEMFDSGELHAALGLPAPDRTPPQITVTPAARKAIDSAMTNADGAVLHLAVDAQFNAQFQLAPAKGREIVADADGLKIHLDPASAPRARGMVVDWVDDVRGAGLSVRNPNAPAPVKSISVKELHDRILTGTIDVIDVRPVSGRSIAPFPQPHEVLDDASRARIEALPKDVPIAFICHHGSSSRRAAEHFRSLGFHDVYTVDGGIDAWAKEIDPSVPVY
ncbi:MAG: Grx4 family monothiol glutaredoxin [Proteobacteria bacterium]|nr:Grx4 family monothiol glutaredoxin [Pseudomonadota bacterium]